MEWREIMHQDIYLLWKHNAFTFHFIIMNNITLRLVFCTIHSVGLEEMASVAKSSPDLHTYLRFYSSLNTFSMIFLIMFALNMTMALIVMAAKYRLMWSRCGPTEGIYLYALPRVMQ